MDGDDWSLNNYKTSGAGAIAEKCTYDAHIADLIRRFANTGLIDSSLKINTGNNTEPLIIEK